MSILQPGKKLGEWTVLEALGEGGNGEVWKAADSAGREGALKVIRDQRAEKVPLARFRREIDVLRDLKGRAGIVPLLDAYVPSVVSRNDRIWYVMEVAEPLRPALSDASPVVIVDAIASLAKVLAGLHSAPRIAHRDIKPENLYLWEERAALGDFGLVQLPDGATLTESGRIPGAFGYIPDELMADPDADGRPADVFALGKVLWVLLSGQRYPPQGHLPAEDGPTSVGRVLTHPRARELDVIISAATAAAPARLDMASLAVDLDEWLAGAPDPETQDEDLEGALLRAKLAMQGDFGTRDIQRVREAAGDDAIALLRAESEPLIEALRRLDSTALVGPAAVDDLRHWIELPDMSGPVDVVWTGHHGARVTRSNGWTRVLLVAFSIQITDDNQLHLDGLVFSGMDGLDQNPLQLGRRSVATGSLASQRAVCDLVQAARERLPRALEEFSK